MPRAKRKIHAYHQKNLRLHSGRKYTDEQIAEMERMRESGMRLSEIAAVFDTHKDDIDRQLNSHGNSAFLDSRPLRARHFDGWDFSGDNLNI